MPVRQIYQPEKREKKVSQCYSGLSVGISGKQQNLLVYYWVIQMIPCLHCRSQCMIGMQLDFAFDIISLMFSKLAKSYLGATIPVVNVCGVIRPQLTEAVAKRLKTLSTSQAVALAVVVNSPGGLPVQSQIISEKLQDFSKKHNLKLYTFARDVAASGGYMVLSAGDHVVADNSSIVGSIGVVFQKLKLRGLLDHFQVDHKHFATSNKLLHDVLSPYDELDADSQQYLKKLCEQAHVKFVQDVKKQRGNKLKNDPSTFSGDVFTGQEALQRGLIDEVGSMVQVLATRHPGAKLDVEPEKRNLLQKVLSL